MDRSLELLDVRDLCVDVLEGLQDRAERVRVVMQEGDRTLLTDRRLLGRAAANLVDNALKYSPADSGCEVHVTWDDETVRLSVQDHGMGIAPVEHDRIFERFYQVDSSDTRRVGGVGLGLSLVREIVESLDGTVVVDSALGRGSTFTISLPAA